MIDLLRMCKRLKTPKLENIADKFVYFGESPVHKKTLILDMDETMLHARFIKPDVKLENDDSHFICHLTTKGSGSGSVEGEQTQSISVKMRPYLDMCLDYLAKYYEICVFTAGTQDYADACLDFLDPEKKIIQHRLYR